MLFSSRNMNFLLNYFLSWEIKIFHINFDQLRVYSMRAIHGNALGLVLILLKMLEFSTIPQVLGSSSFDSIPICQFGQQIFWWRGPLLPHCFQKDLSFALLSVCPKRLRRNSHSILSIHLPSWLLDVVHESWASEIMNIVDTQDVYWIKIRMASIDSNFIYIVIWK